MALWQGQYRAGDAVQVLMPDGSWVDGKVSAGFVPSSGFPVPVDVGGNPPWPVIDAQHIRPNRG